MVGVSVLWCSEAAILAVAAVARTPDSDTGNRSSTATINWLLVLAVALVLASGAIAFAVARQRWLLALPLIGAGIAMLSISAAYFIG